MMRTVKILACSVAVLSLSGCNSFLAELGLGKRGASDPSFAQNDGTSRLEMGKAALRAGAPGNAIHHFERAILDPVQAVDAYNGMGIAYAKLGREDLAERFFNAALMLRPTDERIARNLDRLYNSEIGNSPRALALKEANTDAILAQAEADALARGYMHPEAPKIEKRGAISLDRRRGDLARSSRQEIVISGAEPITKSKPAPAQEALAKRAPDRVGNASPITVGSKPKVEAEAKEVEAAEPEKKDAVAALDFSQIVCLSGSNGARSAQANYPIRVQIGS